MSLPDTGSTLTLNDTKADEDRMRAALGLLPEDTRPAEQSHRPGRESGIAVTVLSTRRPDAPDNARARLATLEAALKAERSERVAAQQALADAKRVIQQLQTKLAHTEMDAVEAEKARLAAEARLLAMENAAALKPAAARPAEPKRRGRPPGKRQVQVVAEMAEPEPVQWWLPSYKASTKQARSRS